MKKPHNPLLLDEYVCYRRRDGFRGSRWNLRAHRVLDAASNRGPIVRAIREQHVSIEKVQMFSITYLFV
jgi:hypothetical protein